MVGGWESENVRSNGPWRAIRPLSDPIKTLTPNTYCITQTLIFTAHSSSFPTLTYPLLLVKFSKVIHCPHPPLPPTSTHWSTGSLLTVCQLSSAINLPTFQIQLNLFLCFCPFSFRARIRFCFTKAKKNYSSSHLSLPSPLSSTDLRSLSLLPTLIIRHCLNQSRLERESRDIHSWRQWLSFASLLSLPTTTIAIFLSPVVSPLRFLSPFAHLKITTPSNRTQIDSSSASPPATAAQPGLVVEVVAEGAMEGSAHLGQAIHHPILKIHPQPQGFWGSS